MSASPDLADIVVTYIKSLWPKVDAKKLEAADYDAGIFSIEVNGHIVGIVAYGVFATWNFVTKDGEFVRPTEDNFFDFIRHWAKLKAGLDDPQTSLVS